MASTHSSGKIAPVSLHHWASATASTSTAAAAVQTPLAPASAGGAFFGGQVSGATAGGSGDECLDSPATPLAIPRAAAAGPTYDEINLVPDATAAEDDVWPQASPTYSEVDMMAVLALSRPRGEVNPVPSGTVVYNKAPPLAEQGQERELSVPKDPYSKVDKSRPRTSPGGATGGQPPTSNSTSAVTSTGVAARGPQVPDEALRHARGGGGTDRGKRGRGRETNATKRGAAAGVGAGGHAAVAAAEPS